MFKGVYRGKCYHKCDITNVLKRCVETKVERLLLTGSSIEESIETIKLANQYGHVEQLKLYYTIGVHPCCVNEFVVDRSSRNYEQVKSQIEVSDIDFSRRKLLELYSLIKCHDGSDNRFRAIGEIGLDYDRLNYSSKSTQLKFFREQLKISCLFPKMPLFLHMRNCCSDFTSIMREFISGFVDREDEFQLKELIMNSGMQDTMLDNEGNAVYRFLGDRKFTIHSFTGTPGELEELLLLSSKCYIGMNGASFREEFNVENVSRVPVDRLMLETDAPWCEIRRAHAGYGYLMSGEGADPWLKVAYPHIEKWYDKVKHENLCKKEENSWDHIMVKSRNEPCNIGQVATVIANIKGMSLDELVSQVWKTTCDVYGE